MSVVAARDQAPQIVRHGPSPQRQAVAPGMTGKDLVRILRKRKWMIITCLLSVFLATAAATKIWLMYAPYFTAISYIEVNPPRTSAMVETINVPQDFMDRLCVQDARLIQGRGVMDDACRMKAVMDTKWFQQDPATAPRRLMTEIDVAPLAKTNLIAVSMKGINRNELPEIVNAVSEAAEANASKSYQDDKRGDLDKLDKELVNLERRLDQSRRTQSTLISDATVTNLQNRRDSLSTTMNTLIPQMTNLTVAQAAADEALRLIQKQFEAGQLDSSPDVQKALDNDQSLRQLQMNESMLITSLDDAKRRFGPRHLQVLKLEGQLASVHQQTKQRHDEVLDLAKKGLVREAEDELNRITAQLVKIRTEYLAKDNEARDLSTRMTSLEQLQVTTKDLEDQIKDCNKRKMDLTLLVNLAPIRLRVRAVLPEEPSMPEWKMMLPLGLIMGLVLGLGLSFLLEIADTSIKSPSDVSRRIDLPLLGMIPHLDDLDEEIEDLRLAWKTAPGSLVGEAFRQIRTCMLFSGPANQRRTLLVTSALPEDGRTSVSLNLASAMCQGGRKVLVVDANFRQPGIKRLFPECPEGGLSSALSGQENWSKMVYAVEPNLSVMAAGPMPPNPAELLGSEQMRQILAEMSSQYDQVIIDGAPCLVVSDSVILSTLVDGVVLAVRAGANTYGIVQRTRDVLNRIGAHIMGVVLNGVRVTAGGYLRKNYDTFYEYRQQQEEAQAEQAQLPAEKTAEKT